MADISKITSILETVEDMSPSGFAIAFHIRMTASEFQFQTYPKDWMKTYSEKGYVMVDPIVAWGFSNNGAIRWSELAELDTHNIFEQSKTYGLNYGVAIGVEHDETRSVAGFARPDREHTDAEIAELTGHVSALHRLTASKNGMSEELRNELHQLSIRMTHPGTT